MELLKELINVYEQIKVTREDDQPVTSDKQSADDLDLPNDTDDQQLDDLDLDDQDNPEEGDAEGDDQPNNMVKRYVKGAHLVYKRANEDGMFEELWVYPVNDIKADLSIRKAILAGTDIDPNTASSPDGTQNCETWSAGNAQMVHLTGLPN